MTCPTQKGILGQNTEVGVIVGGTRIPLTAASGENVSLATSTDDSKVNADLGNPNRIINAIDFNFSFDGQVFAGDPGYEEMHRRVEAKEQGEYYVLYTFPDSSTVLYTGCFSASIDETATENARVTFSASLAGNGEYSRVYTP